MNNLINALKFYSNEALYSYEIDYDMADLLGGDILYDEGQTALKALEAGDRQSIIDALTFYSNEDLYLCELSYDMADLLGGDILYDEGQTALKALKEAKVI